MLVWRIDRWVLGFEKKHGILPEDALFRWILRRPIRSGLIALSIIAAPPSLISFFCGVAVGAWIF